MQISKEQEDCIQFINRVSKKLSRKLRRVNSILIKTASFRYCNFYYCIYIYADEKRINWHYIPSSYEKSSTGYVGLKNQGATCYMNSLMQQFYMIPNFRNGLLSSEININTDPQLENVLYQMQTMLAHLQESQKKFYDTREFCKSYKYDGQPINPSIQMDANEFFMTLFDKLESDLKGTKQVKH